MALVSIIVPVYRAEHCLQRCVESILKQTVADFQLILVDDASPDGSGALCDQLAAADSRIQVIHRPENRGASAARNAGLDAAQGTFVTFCDSDDCVSSMWLEHLLQWASDDTLPMCTYCSNEVDLGKEKNLPVSSDPVSSNNYFLFNQCGIAGFLWNALYSRQVIEKHQLRMRTQHEKGDYNEDLLFALQYVRHMDSIVYTGFADYFYDAHQGSLSTSYKSLYFDKYQEKYQLWRGFLEETRQSELLQDLASTYLYHFLKALDGANYKDFRRIVSSETVQQCIRLADTSWENPKIIHYIKQKAVLRLWLTYQLHHLKGSLL